MVAFFGDLSSCASPAVFSKSLILYNDFAQAYITSFWSSIDVAELRPSMASPRTGMLPSCYHLMHGHITCTVAPEERTPNGGCRRGEYARAEERNKKRIGEKNVSIHTRMGHSARRDNQSAPLKPQPQRPRRAPGVVAAAARRRLLQRAAAPLRSS